MLDPTKGINLHKVINKVRFIDYSKLSIFFSKSPKNCCFGYFKFPLPYFQNFLHVPKTAVVIISSFPGQFFKKFNRQCFCSPLSGYQISSEKK